jgi:glutamyl-tRNA synthetase
MPRQIFIAQGLGYALPQFAHLPFVAEPGGTNKLSKRKLATYLKQKDFKSLFDHGAAIASAIGVDTASESFSPVLLDFYRQVGYLPEAIVNYLLLLGWSLDDKTEDFSRDEMIRAFTLDRVVKSPASFDPQKLLAFQQRHMQRQPVKQKVAMVLPYLQRAGLVSEPPPCDVGPIVRQIVEAAGDRIKVSGDILQFGDFFTDDDQLTYDDAAFTKRLGKPEAVELLRRFRERLAVVEPFDAPTTEAAMQAFIADEEVAIGAIIHPLRVAVTGKSVGFGMFDTLAILGRERTLARIDRALARQ